MQLTAYHDYPPGRPALPSCQKIEVQCNSALPDFIILESK